MHRPSIISLLIASSASTTLFLGAYYVASSALTAAGWLA